MGEQVSFRGGCSLTGRSDTSASSLDTCESSKRSSLGRSSSASRSCGFSESPRKEARRSYRVEEGHNTMHKSVRPPVYMVSISACFASGPVSQSYDLC